VIGEGSGDKSQPKCSLIFRQNESIYEWAVSIEKILKKSSIWDVW